MSENRSADQCRRRVTRILLLIMAFGSLLSGCAGGRPAILGATYDLPETALHALAASDPMGTVTATARIDINNHGDRYPLKAAMMIRRPANLRFESIPLLGPPDFFLSIDNGELRVFLPGKGVFYTGPASSWTIARFFPLALPAAEIVSLLMGRLPAEEGTSSSWDGGREGELYRVDQYRNGKKIRSLWIDPAGGILIRIRTFTERDEVAYTADFAEHIRVGKGFMPQRSTISLESVSLALRYTDIRMLDDDAASFSLPIPEGIAPIPLQEQ